MKIANLYLQKLKNNELTDFTLLGTQSMSPPFLDWRVAYNEFML